MIFQHLVRFVNWVADLALECWYQGCSCRSFFRISRCTCWQATFLCSVVVSVSSLVIVPDATTTLLRFFFRLWVSLLVALAWSLVSWRDSLSIFLRLILTLWVIALPSVSSGTDMTGECFIVLEHLATYFTWTLLWMTSRCLMSSEACFTFKFFCTLVTSD